MTERICNVEGCERKHYAKDMCSLHYIRLRRYGTTDDPRREKATSCSVEGCEKPVGPCGLCRMHYYRMHRHGSTDDPLPREIQICSFEGCGRRSTARDWCGKHYQRWRVYGDPAFVTPRTGLKECNPIVDKQRVCSACGVTWPIEQFNRSRAHPGGRHPWCKACRSASRRDLYATDPARYAEIQKWKTTKYRFGLTREAYKALHDAQGGACSICGHKQERLTIDHDHSCCPDQKTCGKCIRGLLCFRCNSLLGLGKDSPDLLLAAVAYLRSWSKSL